ncbi:MAG: RNA-binding cell elongation regulator Jag/EloR [Gaiellales bacterium]
MSDELIRVEATGETVGEAKWAALRELERLAPGVDKDAVEFQVVSEGERGLLGVGYTPAQVVAVVPAPGQIQRRGAAPDSPEGTVVVELLGRVCDAIGVPASVELDERDDEIVATLHGGDAGVLIGRHGQMIDALQYLANALAHRAAGDVRRPITVDAAGYRDRRTSTLVGIARRAAEQAAATGTSVTLEPMSAVERKVVHEALKDDPEIETGSEGAEPYRCVVVHARRTVG